MTMAQLASLTVAENAMNEAPGKGAPERGTAADLMALASIGGG